jgi:hypothetical protein
MKVGCVPRMLRSMPHLRRGALLIRGPSLYPWVPVLRSSVKNAAPRPGHDTPLIFEIGYSSTNVAASGMLAREVR